MKNWQFSQENSKWPTNSYIYIYKPLTSVVIKNAIKQ